MTREDLETSPKPKLHIPINQSNRQPASERLREYLKGLEKKLESVSTMVDGPQSGGKRWEPSHRSTNHMTSSSKTLQYHHMCYFFVSRSARLCFRTMESLFWSRLQIHPSKAGIRATHHKRLQEWHL